MDKEYELADSRAEFERTETVARAASYEAKIGQLRPRQSSSSRQAYFSPRSPWFRRSLPLSSARQRRIP
jgi:hypothetical protein